jgi:hypothetical protein
MTELEKREKRIKAIGEIHNAGFEIVHRHPNTVEPMLMGGYEYIARRGNYLLAYNIVDKTICLQETKDDHIDWDSTFVLKWFSFDNFVDGLLSSTIAKFVGLDYYKEK